MKKYINPRMVAETEAVKKYLGFVEKGQPDEIQVGHVEFLNEDGDGFYGVVGFEKFYKSTLKKIAEVKKRKGQGSDFWDLSVDNVCNYQLLNKKGEPIPDATLLSTLQRTVKAYLGLDLTEEKLKSAFGKSKELVEKNAYRLVPKEKNEYLKIMTARILAESLVDDWAKKTSKKLVNAFDGDALKQVYLAISPEDKQKTIYTSAKNYKSKDFLKFFTSAGKIAFKKAQVEKLDKAFKQEYGVRNVQIFGKDESQVSLRSIKNSIEVLTREYLKARAYGVVTNYALKNKDYNAIAKSVGGFDKYALMGAGSSALVSGASAAAVAISVPYLAPIAAAGAVVSSIIPAAFKKKVGNWLHSAHVTLTRDKVADTYRRP